MHAAIIGWSSLLSNLKIFVCTSKISDIFQFMMEINFNPETKLQEQSLISQLKISCRLVLKLDLVD